MEMALTPWPLLCSSILFLVLSSCSLANGSDAHSSSSPATSSAAAANGTAALSSAVPPLPPVVIVVHHHFHRELVIAAVLACIATVTIFLSTLYAWTLWRRSRRSTGSKGTRSSDAAKGIKLVPILSRFNSVKASRKRLVGMFEYPSLEAATEKFSESNVLGVGGFGRVYKAAFDAGVTAAVKRLDGGGPDCVIFEFTVRSFRHKVKKAPESLFQVQVLSSGWHQAARIYSGAQHLGAPADRGRTVKPKIRGTPSSSHLNC